MTPRTETLTIRIDSELKRRMEAAQASMPYQPTMTSIVQRGIQLALEEMERMRKAAEGGK